QLERGLNRLRALSYREAYELLSAEASRAAKTDPALAARLYAAVTLVANVYREAPPALASAEEAVRLAGRRGDEVELEALFALVSAPMSRGLPPDDEDDGAATRRSTCGSRSKACAGALRRARTRSSTHSLAARRPARRTPTSRCISAGRCSPSGVSRRRRRTWRWRCASSRRARRARGIGS